MDGLVDTLLYFDTEMIAFSSFEKLLLPKDRSVSLRPVMLLNRVGLTPEQPLDDYWKPIYADAGADPASLSTVRAYVDEKTIRFYVNCEVMAVRPELGIFRAWRTAFLNRIADAAYLKNDADPLRRIFLHQAVLSAVILAKIAPDKISWINDKYVYFDHLHDRMPPPKKIDRLNLAPVAGYDLQYAGNPGFLSLVPIDEPYRSWIIQTYGEFLAQAPGIYREEGSSNTSVVAGRDGYILIDPSATGYPGSWLALKFGSKPPSAVEGRRHPGRRDHASGRPGISRGLREGRVVRSRFDPKLYRLVR